MLKKCISLPMAACEKLTGSFMAVTRRVLNSVGERFIEWLLLLTDYGVRRLQELVCADHATYIHL